MSLISSKALPSATVMAAVALAIAAPSVRAQQVAQSADSETALQEVIVTGTRQSGLSAAESPAPIQILSADALKAAAGNPDLMSTLAQIVPAPTIEGFGLDMAGETARDEPEPGAGTRQRQTPSHDRQYFDRHRPTGRLTL